MGRVLKVGLWGLGSLLAVLLAAFVVFLGYRAVRQHAAAERLAITTPDGVQESMFVRAGGLDQWITIRGQDRGNPVLLMIDGGPGAAASAFPPSPWERQFTIVEWDQPGAGKTFGKAGGRIDPSLSIDEIARDGTQVAEAVRQRLHKRQVGLYASSWGTIVGMHMLKLRPDLFYAYVGTGQTVSLKDGEPLNYADVLAKARARRDDKAMRELQRIGPPPYRSFSDFTVQRKWASAYEAGGPDNTEIVWSLLLTPGYSLWDVRNWLTGFLQSNNHFFGPAMDGPLMSVDLRTLGPDFQTPVFMFQGTEDDYAPFSLAKGYFDLIQAPQKLFVAAPGAGHYAAFSQNRSFERLLVDHVRPLGEAAEASAPPPGPPR